eukprot:PhM_4_TR2832/c0_g1_i1/m.88912
MERVELGSDAVRINVGVRDNVVVANDVSVSPEPLMDSVPLSDDDMDIVPDTEGSSVLDKVADTGIDAVNDAVFEVVAVTTSLLNVADIVEVTLRLIDTVHVRDAVRLCWWVFNDFDIVMVCLIVFDTVLDDVLANEKVAAVRDSVVNVPERVSDTSRLEVADALDETSRLSDDAHV